MARGAVSKEEVMNKILSTFEGSFRYDKEVRVPMMENGELIQIKITLTAAKTNVEPGGDTAMPGAVKSKVTSTSSTSASAASNIGSASSHFMNEPTEEEKKNVAELISKLGL